eukprot:gb/GFBE01082100.1/.p1 GENE.gb/GFBE01082100.1/~~gb/GFBE01082100.1/.p1  ORF type:complete len:333 (+),score=63.03 gb/GFBE01082100.1/:1-999(+)
MMSLLSGLYLVSLLGRGLGGPTECANTSRKAQLALDLDEAPSMALLQLGLKARNASRASQGSDALPLKWMHIPKSGTSILTSLAHLPGVCEGIPEDLIVDEDHLGTSFEENFMTSICQPSCPGLDCHHSSQHHGAIGLEYEEYYKGHGVSMFRQPEQRIISEYNMVSIPGSRFYHPATTIAFPTVSSFAEHVEGCMARMLTENSGSPCFSSMGSVLGPAGKVPADQLALAKERLREGFVFVGITEQWDLSICLLHAMFGGECSAKEFEDSRPGMVSNDAGGYDTSELGGFVDEADREIYQLALDIFSENLAKYGVSNESCSPCWEQASTSAA